MPTTFHCKYVFVFVFGNDEEKDKSKITRLRIEWFFFRESESFILVMNRFSGMFSLKPWPIWESERLALWEDASGKENDGDRDLGPSEVQLGLNSVAWMVTACAMCVKMVFSYVYSPRQGCLFVDRTSDRCWYVMF